MKTSIIILTYNKLEYTKQCIESIRKYTKFGTYEIIIVDNNSTDDTVAWLKEQHDIISIFNSENMGFPKGCNQGIKVAAGDNILLLNNDVIVTPRWLENLLACLYSNENIGAAGPITNSCSYYQSIKVQYKNNEEMLVFADDYNKSNPEKWEDRLKLVGFCMLIKKQVIDKVGLLDEIFTPGNFEDDDLSLRIISQGYRLVLCKDTFIHHFGSVSFSDRKAEYNELLRRNLELFEKKWNSDIFHIINIRNDISSLIKENKDKEFNVLQLECGGCGTLMDIKNNYPKCHLYGTEVHENVLINRNLDVEIALTDIEKLEINYRLGFFDYIIIADLDVNVYKLTNIFAKIRKYLKEEGKILITLSKDTNAVNYFINMLPFDFDKDCIEGIDSRNQYICSLTRKKIGELERAIDKIENEEQTEINLQNITDYINDDELHFQEILELIHKYAYNKEKILNLLGTSFYEKRKYDFVIPSFETVLKYDSRNRNAILNLSSFLYELKHYELALRFIDRIDITDDEIYEIRKNLIEKAVENGIIKRADRPLISICIPTYNRAANLRTCLESIFKQVKSWMDIEVVIANNDSTDNTEDVVREFTRRYDNIVYVKNETNIGGDRNILRIPQYANGKFVFLHGDDDFFVDGSLADVYKLAESNIDKSIIFFDITKNDKKIIEISSADEFVRHITGTSAAFMSSIMMNKDIYYKFGNKDRFIESNLNQIYTILSIIEENGNACICNYSLFWYANNLSGGYEWPKVFVENYLDILIFFKDKGTISEITYKFEKERVLKQSVINWLMVFKKQNKIEIFGMQNLDEYLLKYYKDEPYFVECYRYIEAIRNGE